MTISLLTASCRILRNANCANQLPGMTSKVINLCGRIHLHPLQSAWCTNSMRLSSFSRMTPGVICVGESDLWSLGGPTATRRSRREHQGTIPVKATLHTSAPIPSGEASNSQALRSDGSSYRRELNTINVAVAANLAIFFAKCGACYFSLSSSMFAEAVHSLADVGNQVLLRTGVVQALKGPTAMHPYGFSRDKFVWSLMSAVGIFFLGAGFTVFKGFQGLLHPTEVLDYTITYWVLGGSFVLEGISFLVALRAVAHNAAKRGMKVVDYIWLGKDPTPIAVMLEDSGAVIGILIAGACTALSSYTGSSLFDSLGSIAIGVLMGGVATFLIRMNRSFLIGRSIGKHEMSLILKQLREDPVVKNVYDYKSEEIGPGKYRFKAEIDFCGEEVVQRHLMSINPDEVYEQLRCATWTKDERAMNTVLREYGKQLVSQVGAEVDRLEAKIIKIVPGVVHVDLEVDRGKVEKKLHDLRVDCKMPDLTTEHRNLPEK